MANSSLKIHIQSGSDPKKKSPSTPKSPTAKSSASSKSKSPSKTSTTASGKGSGGKKAPNAQSPIGPVGAPPPTPEQKQAMVQSQKFNAMPTQEPKPPADVDAARQRQTKVLKSRIGRETKGRLQGPIRDTDVGGDGFYPAQSPML